MAFNEEATRIPQAIGRIEILLISPDPLSGQQDEAQYEVQVKYNNGETKNIYGNLVPHLSPAQISSAQSFLAAMRTKAVAEILP